MMQWVLGAVAGVVGLVGLLLASRTHEGALHYLGFALFGLAVVAIFYMVVQATGQPPRRDDLGPAAEP